MKRHKNFYSLYDIPSIMLATVKIIIKKHKKAFIVLCNADTIKKGIIKLTKGTKIEVVFRSDRM